MRPFWHHHIHYDKVQRLLPGYIEGFYPIKSLKNAISFVSEINLDGPRYFLIVVTHQDIEFMVFHFIMLSFRLTTIY